MPPYKAFNQIDCTESGARTRTDPSAHQILSLKRLPNSAISASILH